MQLDMSKTKNMTAEELYNLYVDNREIEIVKDCVNSTINPNDNTAIQASRFLFNIAH